MGLGLFAASANAVDLENWYVQGNLGYANFDVDDSAGLNADRDGTYNVRLSAGYDFGLFRVAGDYTHYGKAKGDITYGGVKGDYSLKTDSLGLTGFYDFTGTPNFTPYVGARVAFNKTKFKANVGTFSASDSDKTFGVGALAGFQYKLTPELALDANIEGDIVTSDVTQYGAAVGLRYDF